MSINNQNENNAWHLYLVARKRWLKDTYLQKGTVGKDKIQEAIEKLNQYFEQLQNLPPKYRKTFIPEFSKYIEKKMFRSIPRESPYETSSEQTPMINNYQEHSKVNYSEYDKMRYRHYLEMIRFLSANHLKFHYIAQHLLIDDQRQLLFQMERGIDSIEGLKSNKKSFIQSHYQEQTATWDSDDPNLMWILLRDLAEAILQLEDIGIYHSDIEIHNILLFNCENVLDLKDPAKLTALLGKIRFKLIDFEDAFFIDCNRHGIKANSFDEMIQFLRDHPAEVQKIQKDHLKTIFTAQCMDSKEPYKTEFMKKSHVESYRAIIKQKQDVLKKDQKDRRVDKLLELLSAEKVDYKAIIKQLTKIISQI